MYYSKNHNSSQTLFLLNYFFLLLFCFLWSISMTFQNWIIKLRQRSPTAIRATECSSVHMFPWKIKFHTRRTNAPSALEDYEHSLKHLLSLRTTFVILFSFVNIIVLIFDERYVNELLTFGLWKRKSYFKDVFEFSW